MPQSAEGFGHRGKARLLPIRPGLPIAGHPREDEAGVRCAQGLVPEPPFLEDPGPEIFDEHVGLRDQPAEHLLPLRVAQIERNTLFVAGDARPPQALAVHERLSDRPHRVALAGGFDLDDFRAEVRQQPRTERPGQQHAAFDDSNAGQRPGRRSDTCFHTRTEQ